MTDKELSRLKRGELLEMLLEQSREVERLKAELETAQTALEERSIRIDHAGSIAEAALQVNGVFEAAQEAAKQYLENVESLSHRQEKICEERTERCKQDIRQMLSDAKHQCEKMKAETNRECEDKLRETEIQVNEKWNKISQNLEMFYQAHEDLRELIGLSGKE